MDVDGLWILLGGMSRKVLGVGHIATLSETSSMPEIRAQLEYWTLRNLCVILPLGR